MTDIKGGLNKTKQKQSTTKTHQNNMYYKEEPLYKVQTK